MGAFPWHVTSCQFRSCDTCMLACRDRKTQSRVPVSFFQTLRFVFVLICNFRCIATARHYENAFLFQNIFRSNNDMVTDWKEDLWTAPAPPEPEYLPGLWCCRDLSQTDTPAQET